MSVEKFASIFEGLKCAYGFYRIDGEKANGKKDGKGGVIRKEPTLAVFKDHLEGNGQGIGIIPINEDDSCRWGCIDIDQYPLDHEALINKIRELKLPLVVCRSKSGGAHCFLFSSDWVSAEDMQKSLKNVSATLGYGGSEIFPKQIRLHLDRGDVGNYLNLPYYNGEDGLRYGFLDDGTSATLEQFIELYDKYVQTPEQVKALQITKNKETKLLADGPPCLQILAREKISEGGRNNGLFNFGVYLRKAHSDTWEDELLKYNSSFISPALPLREVNTIAKQIRGNKYEYKCGDSPINSYCNKDLCRTRKHGVGSASSGATIANLRKYNSTPPLWFLDVNGEPLELDTEGLMSQGAFQKSCLEQLNFMPRTMKKDNWEGRISGLLSEMKENDGAIIEVSQDVTSAGQFYDYLEEFCTQMQQADDKEGILLRRPWTDDETELTYFRLKDFEDFLKKNKFFEFKRNKIGKHIKDIQGENIVMNIKGKSVRVWKIPKFENQEIPVSTPKFKQKESPF